MGYPRKLWELMISPSARLFPAGPLFDLRLWGSAALLVWMVTFAVGSLVPSCPMRRALDRELSDDCSKRSGTTAERTAPSGQTIVRGVALASTSPEILGEVQGSHTDDGAGVDTPQTSRLTAFIVGTLSYTPSNLALLALATGFIGGCASRLTWAAKRAQRLEREGAHAPSTPSDNAQPIKRDESYLRESPFASMFRSFVAYLLALAGLLVISPEMFKSPSAETYMRMAGLVSALAFAVGYDPTRLSAILSQIPGNSTTSAGGTP